MGAGLGAAASAAAQIAATKMQIDAQKQARKQAVQTANEVAPTVTQAGKDANALLQPYQSVGNNAANMLQNGMTQQALEQTPGYQFTRQQGLESVASNASARGLANSGAMQKGIANFVTGLADNTYNTRFNETNALLGTGFAANQAAGNNTINTTTNAGQIRMSGANGNMAGLNAQGNALAAGITGAGNAIGQGITAGWNDLFGGGQKQAGNAAPANNAASR